MEELTEKEKAFIRHCIFVATNRLEEPVPASDDMDENLTLTEARDVYAKVGGENFVRKLRAAETDEGA